MKTPSPLTDEQVLVLKAISVYRITAMDPRPAGNLQQSLIDRGLVFVGEGGRLRLTQLGRRVVWGMM